MKKSTIEIIATSALGIIFILILWANLVNPLMKKKRSRVKRRAVPVVAIPSQAPIGETAASPEARKEKFESLSWSRDPFFLGRVEEEKGGVTLTGIIWNEENPSAIINDTLVEIGDEINGVKIVEITRDSVTIDDAGNMYELQIWHEE